MLPSGLLAEAIHLCAAGLGAAGAPLPTSYAIKVHAGATLTRAPANEADAIATVRDLLARGADFDAGPLAISGSAFARFGVTARSVFDACALAQPTDRPEPHVDNAEVTVTGVAGLVRQAFDARITDTIRPMNARYGARHSWHKLGQAIDFVPHAGVGSITRGQVRAAMTAAGIRIVELLGPGDPGHANHWHLAFARPEQTLERPQPADDSEIWIVDVAAADPPGLRSAAAVSPALSPSLERAKYPAPPRWDVFAIAARRNNREVRS